MSTSQGSVLARPQGSDGAVCVLADEQDIAAGAPAGMVSGVSAVRQVLTRWDCRSRGTAQHPDLKGFLAASGLPLWAAETPLVCIVRAHLSA